MLENAWIIWCFVPIVQGVNSESKCFPRFDYNKELLMKAVKIEHQIEILKSEKAERKKEFETEVEVFRKQSAEEIQKQRNFTAMLAEKLNSEKTEKLESVETESKTFREKSSAEMQKQKTITSAIVEIQNEQKKSFKTEIEGFAHQLTSAIQKQQDLNALLYENLNTEKMKRMRSFEAEMEEFRYKFAEEKQNQRNLSSILQMNDTLLNFFKVPSFVFTVTNPAKGSTADAVTFANEIINEGGGFDTATGKFTCPLSGIYYFNLHLMKSSESYTNQVSCYIKKNSLNTVRAHVDPRNDNGIYGVSNSVYLTLSVGDVITIGGCYHEYVHDYYIYREQIAANSMESWSSFSGYMVRPNLLMPKTADG